MHTQGGKQVGRPWRRLLGVGLVVGLLAVFGCGEQTPPIGPQKPIPLPPTQPVAPIQTPPAGVPNAGAPDGAPGTGKTPTPPQPKQSTELDLGQPRTSMPIDGARAPGLRYHGQWSSADAPPDFQVSTAVECYGNVETMGVILKLPEGAALSAGDRLGCELWTEGRWRRMQDLVQIASSRNYATSLFWLQANKPYWVKVSWLSADGVAKQSWFGQGATREVRTTPRQKSAKVWVSQSATAAGDGSEAKPFTTIGAAMAAVQGKMGDAELIIGSGVYYEGDFQITGLRGREGQGLWIRAAEGANVVIDGSNPELTDPGVWQPEADGLYSHALKGKCQCVVLEDAASGKLTRLMPIYTAEELRTRTVAKHEGFEGSTFAKEQITGAFAADGEKIWLLPPAPLKQYKVHIGRGTRAFNIEKSGPFYLSGVTVRYFGKEDYSCVALVQDSSNATFDGCHFIMNDVGIWLKGASNNVTVRNCYFLDGVTNFPFGMQKVGGSPFSFEAGAVNVDSKFSGRGLVIQNNHIEGLFDGVHLCPWKVDDAVTNEIDFCHNTVLDCVDDFIETDGYSRNVRIYDNYMRRALTGVSIAQALDGPTYVCYNVIADCGLVPATTREGNGGYPVKTNGGDHADVGSGEVFFYHNTAYTTDPDSRAMLVKRPTWRKLTFRNNIWYGKKYGFECWKNPPSPMDFDYDNLFSADPAAALVVLNYKTKLQTLADLRKSMHWLEHGISADPKIADEKNGDYSLQQGSPCVDAGVLIPGINDLRSFGAAPDMGAFEVMGPGH